MIFGDLLRGQRRLSARLDRLLPLEVSVDGNQDFRDTFVPKYLERCQTVYDIGGGKHPYLDPERKQALGARVIGLDVDAEELAGAPPGVYDRTIVADITRYRGEGDADLVICQALLEHVPDTERAFAAIASSLKAGGLALLFVPSRNAVYSRLNTVLPEGLKRRLLFTLLPGTRARQGFPAWYDRCTPSAFRQLAEGCGLTVVEERHYFVSSYFSVFFPAYLAWRAWVLLYRWLAGAEAAETFSMCLRKDGLPRPAKDLA